MRTGLPDKEGGLYPCGTLTVGALACGLSIIHSCMLHHFVEASGFARRPARRLTDIKTNIYTFSLPR